jgi:hypothetical protein
MSGVTPAERRRHCFACGLAVLGITALASPLGLRVDGAFAEQSAAVIGGSAAATTQPLTYTIRVIKQGDDKLKLKGLVATKDDHRAVLGLVKASFPAADVTDRIKIADNPGPDAPRSDIKLGSISFALKALSYLQVGSARIDEETVSLSGSIENRVDYNEIKALIDTGRPTGIAVTEDIVEPTSFAWRAEISEGKVRLTGAVPDSSDKKELESTVQKLFSGLEIADYTYVADGAPESWLDAAMHSLKVLKLLNSGYVILADHSVELDGHAKDEATLRKIDDLADRYPAGFALASKVSVPTLRASMFGAIAFPHALAVHRAQASEVVTGDQELPRAPELAGDPAAAAGKATQ